jgi:hypothetical protein
VLPELFASTADTEQAGLLKEQEQRAIADAMQRFDGDKVAVSRELGISPTTLWRRLKEMDWNSSFGTAPVQMVIKASSTHVGRRGTMKCMKHPLVQALAAAVMMPAAPQLLAQGQAWRSRKSSWYGAQARGKPAGGADRDLRHREKTIQRAGIQRAGDFVGLVPNVTLVDTANVGDTQLSIRGIISTRDAERPLPTSSTVCSAPTPTASTKSSSTCSRSRCSRGRRVRCMVATPWPARSW